MESLYRLRKTCLHWCEKSSSSLPIKAICRSATWNFGSQFGVAKPLSSVNSGKGAGSNGSITGMETGPSRTLLSGSLRFTSFLWRVRISLSRSMTRTADTRHSLESLNGFGISSCKRHSDEIPRYSVLTANSANVSMIKTPGAGLSGHRLVTRQLSACTPALA